MRIVKVVWNDSLILNEGGWMDLKEAKEALSSEAMQQTSIGFLVADNKEAILIASGHDNQKNAPMRILGGVVIPHSAIVSINDLVEQEPDRRGYSADRS